ncbi:hypothetical protein C8R47DRAFT_446406 [Mycena vitilis]|nr:hypothetical protein C8R47DRAFT_446406 [Mycena vitilis]
MTPFRRIITHTLLAAILLIGVQSAPNPDLARRDDSATSSTSPTSATPTIFSSDAGAVATGANPTSISGSDQSTSPSGVISSTAAVASPSTFIPCRNVSKPVPDNYLCQDFLDEVAPSLSQPDFIKLNPDIGADCSALIANHTYCLEADPDPPSTVYFYSDALNQTVGPIPNAGNPMANQYCATFYYPEDNDTCFQIGQTFGATTAALYFMNVPDILDNCDAYRPYMWYCVKMKYNSPSVNSTQITASDEVISVASPPIIRLNIESL